MDRISVFDIFKIGIGPSSSHTMGPWKAALRFVSELENNHLLNKIIRVGVTCYGSLAKTGIGHGTDIAVMMGLSGADPKTVAEESILPAVEYIRTRQLIMLGGKMSLAFHYKTDLIFNKQEDLPRHPNGIRFRAELATGEAYANTYYSIGGGFILAEDESGTSGSVTLPYPVDCGHDLLQHCHRNRRSIPEIVMENELVWRDEETIRHGLMEIYHTMTASAFRGCHTTGLLPGGLNVVRKAAKINRRLLGNLNQPEPEEWISMIASQPRSFENISRWISCFALAVNEVNASFGRVVTAPTNGSAGVIPSVLLYYRCFSGVANESDIIRFLLTAGEIGSIFKKGATISAALGGCQAEIGVSSAMAAAALTECRGGDAPQVLMAAEIAMEHHLGLTCDPVKGLVQIPCIERNTMGAIKAITASNIALDSRPDEARVSLDEVIRTMWDTARDMDTRYKETAEGGLAMNISVNIPEC
jgi:L-serine dehydratase